MVDHMDASEWKRLAAAVNADIAGLTRAAHTQASIHSILSRRQQAPTEEQVIDNDAFDANIGQPRNFSIAGAEVRVWKVHRVGLDLSDIKGADLYYELGEKKFVLVQYKIPSRSGRITLDNEQLQELQDACPVSCLPTRRFECGAWYALRKSDAVTDYFPACEARQLFAGHSSRKSDYFVNGLAKPQFHDDFGLCHIGARTKLIDLESYRDAVVADDHVFVHAKSVNGGRNAI